MDAMFVKIVVLYIDNKRHANGHWRSFDIRDQSISCQIDPSKASEKFTVFLHELCSWIYLGDDEKHEDEDEDEDDEGKDQEDD